jgi:hypothetical protein
MNGVETLRGRLQPRVLILRLAWPELKFSGHQSDTFQRQRLEVIPWQLYHALHQPLVGPSYSFRESACVVEQTG